MDNLIIIVCYKNSKIIDGSNGMGYSCKKKSSYNCD